MIGGFVVLVFKTDWAKDTERCAICETYVEAAVVFLRLCEEQKGSPLTDEEMESAITNHQFDQCGGQILLIRETELTPTIKVASQGESQCLT